MSRITLGGKITCDVPALVDTRLLVQANSGGGKSWVLRRLLEQTHGRVQHLVIDPEGEFASLRERYDYVLAARQGGDTATDPRTAKLLAERLLELGASAIIDIYELKAHDRVRFVRFFLESLVDAPKKLWHPALVVVDEAHVYCMSADTQILSTDGWVSHDQVSEGTVVAAYDLTTDGCRWESVSHVIRREHAGEMVHLKTKGLDCLVTPDHRVVLRRFQHNTDRYRWYPWEFRPAASLPVGFKIPAVRALAQPESGIPGLTPEVCRVLGWMLTDGHYHHKAKSNSLAMQQAVSTMKGGTAIAAAMDAELQLLGASSYDRPARDTMVAGRATRSSESKAWYLPEPISEELLGWLGGDLLPKTIRRIPRRLLVESSTSQLKALFQGLLEGDGTTAGGSEWRAFYPGLNEGLADDFQELAARLGICTTKRYEGSNSQWQVGITVRTDHQIRRAARQQYHGLVWDITVPSGAFLARRNGRLFITGNCPQKGDAESAAAVIDLCTRGRKRGFCAVLATQRLSKLHKDAAAELNNKLIGRTGLDVDMLRAAEELGFTGRDERLQLRGLEPGEFFCFGPALTAGVERVKIGSVETTHPKAGARLAHVAPPPTAKIKALLPKLADLPAEAEHRERTVADLKRELADSRRQLTIAQKGQPAAPAREKIVEKRVEVPILKAAQADKLLKFGDRLVTVATDLLTFGKELVATIRTATNGPRAPIAPRPAVPARPVPVARPQSRSTTRTSEPIDGVSRSQQRILDVLAWLEAIGLTPAHKTQVAIFAGQSPTSGGYFNNLGVLRSSGLIDYPQPTMVALTDTGRAAAEPPGIPATTDDLHRQLEAQLPRSQWAILKACLDAYPEDLAKDEVANQVGQSPTSGGFFNNLGRLRSLGLIDYPTPGRVMALPVLFLEEARR